MDLASGIAGLKVQLVPVRRICVFSSELSSLAGPLQAVSRVMAAPYLKLPFF